MNLSSLKSCIDLEKVELTKPITRVIHYCIKELIKLANTLINKLSAHQ